MPSRVFLSVMLLLFLVSSAARGADIPKEAPVDLSAAELEYQRETESWRAEGEVRLQKGDLTLMADQVRWNAATGDASATGQVQVTDPQAIVTGDEVHLNTENGTGRLRNGTILIREQNYRIAGEEIERLGEQHYRISRGTFTTCEGESPAWKFSAKNLDVTLGGWAGAQHVLFYLKDIPVFYTPFFAYPVKTERESGFLPPRIGSSSRRGTQLSLAWYEVIDRNQDATLSVDYLSKLGIGTGLEYRYIFGQADEGIMNAYQIIGMSEGDSRYALDWQHAGGLPGKLRLIADVEYVSSRDYFEDFGVVAEEYSREEAQSVLAVSRYWERSTLTGQLKYTKDLEAENDFTLQKLPEIVYHRIPTRWRNTPFFFAVDGASTYFWRREGLTGERITLRPELSAVFQPADLLEIRPAVGYRERLYWTSGEGDDPERDGIADFSTRLSTRFSRVFDLDIGGVRKILHSLDPEVTYRYVPNEDQGDLPRFDALDRIGPENRLVYALVNRLVARLEPVPGEPVYHEYLYLRLSQEYDIRESRRDLPPEGNLRPFSPLRMEVVARPTSWSYLDLDLRYDVNSGAADRFPLLAGRAGINDQVGNGAAIDYRYQPADEISYLSGSLNLAWFRPVYVGYLHRHDLESGTTLEKVLSLEYRSQCWSVLLTLRDRPEDTEYLIAFTLSGLGKVTELGGSLGGPRN